MPKRTRLVIVICVVAIATVTATIALLPAAQRTYPDQPPIAVAVDTTKVGSTWDPAAIGLSFEATELNNANLVAGNFKQYLKTLGPGTLRFGANAADDTFWTTTEEQVPDWAKGTVRPADLMRLAALAKETGWKVSIAVNFKHFEPSRAADQVANAQRILGTSLDSVQIGNEPDVYYDDFDKYLSSYDTYVKAIEKAAPGVNLVGADLQGRHGFPAKFAAAQKTRKDVSTLTLHFYPQSACPDSPEPDIHKLLSPEWRSSQEKIVNAAVADATAVPPPIQINETNSVSCEGSPGVSDVYGAALWAFDYSLMAQRSGVSRLEFHGSLAQCGAAQPAYKFYTPLCASSRTGSQNGVMKAQPEYTGLLAAKRIPAGKFVGVDNPGWQHVRAFAIDRKSTLSLVLVNIDEPGHFGIAPVDVKFDKPYASADLMTLQTTSRKGFSAKNDITLGDRKIDEDGRMEDPQRKAILVRDGAATIRTAPGTVTIVNFR